jgi:Holliday junction resolvase-like predicted endonuclease
MEYSVFKDILNQSIFENSKKDLIEKIAASPDRYVGLFRPTRPKAKLLQNLLQSHEIKFGEALENLFEKYFEKEGFEILEKKMVKNGDHLNLDQLFTDKKYIYFVEQKVRDDHDSSKKRGQINNFEKKIETLLEIYKESELKAYTYFIDPEFQKNKRYYQNELNKLQNDYNIFSKLCYGRDFWDEIKHPEIWDELLLYLERWKKEIPEMPSINYDENAEKSFNEIKGIKASDFRKLFTNKKICEEIFPILFPQNKVLLLLSDYFKMKSPEQSIYKRLFELVNEAIRLNI